MAKIKEDIRYLLFYLREYKLNEQILQNFWEAAHLHQMRKFDSAEKKYMVIGMGDKLWSLGLSELGVYERTGKSRVFFSYILHHLNNKVQRVYIWAFKRLLTQSQKCVGE